MSRFISQLLVISSIIYYSVSQETVDTFTPFQEFNGVSQQLFLRYFMYDEVENGAPKEFIAGFTVKVDDYSQLVIPNIKSK